MGGYCDVCRRRPAVYYRRYSGQRLCLPCLRRSLEKALRRSIGEAGGLRPGSTVAVAARLSAPHLGGALAELAARVESTFNVRVILMMPEQASLEGPTPGFDVASVRVDPPGNGVGLVECLRFEAAWASLHALRLGADAALLPVTITDRILAGLEALVQGWWWALADYSVRREPRAGVPVIYAPSTVEGEALAAYAAARGWRGWAACRPRGASRPVFYSVAQGRPELEYSTVKTLGRLAAEASGRAPGECPWCGGASPEPGACPACSRTKPWLRVGTASSP